MKEKRRVTGDLQLEELQAVYAISRVVASTVDIDEALAEIVRLARPVFIFDTAVLYLVNKESGELEPAFARAVGRGRSEEERLPWGDVAARKAFESGEIFLSEAKPDPKADRLELGFYLGQPLIVGGKKIGALIFIRFGGPSYTGQQINLAEFIAAHVTQVLEHQRLVERVANLEAERRLVRLQSDFLATISHELKTPLGFIKGYATTLLRRDTHWEKEEIQEFMEIIDEEADRLAELVDNLLDSSRLQSGTLPMELKTVEINTLVEEVVNRLSSRYGDLSLELHAPEPDIYIKADPKRISQVIENLVSNAAKYAPRSRVLVTVKELENSTTISVRDEGPGIAEADLEQVFKRFYRGPRSSETVRGSGLGLYICKQIVEAHGGNIRVTSSEGKGATFTLELPKEMITQPA